MGSNKSRKDMRAVVSLVARYRSPTTFEYANEACADLSVGGMFIKSAAPAPAGTLLKLECEVDAQDARIRGVARVVWLRRENSENGPSGMGVKFVKLEAGSRELIETIVTRLAEAGVEARAISSAAPELYAPRAKSAPAEAPTPNAGPVGQPTPASSADSLPSSAGTASPAMMEGLAASAIREPAPETQPAPDEHRIASADANSSASVWDGRASDEVDSTRPSTRPSGSVRPTPGVGKSRFGVRGWILAGALLLLAIVLADRRGIGTSEPDAPAREITAVVPEAPPAPPQAAAPQEPPAAPVPEAPSPDNEAAPATSAVTETTPGPQPKSAIDPNIPAYVIDFVSRPNAASVTIDGETSLVTPASLNLGAMPQQIKVTARKPGYQSSSIWLERDGFELKDGVMRRRVYLTLKRDPGSPPPP